jgi:2'-hydroxyisoflavone reductase
MKLLVLGGTLFLGRHVVEHALERGHAVTLLTRGRTNPELFPEAERLIGDRDGDLAALRGRTWDAVIDTCGYVPRIAGASAAALKDAVGHYTFISSISVYAELNAPGVTEEAPVASAARPQEIGPDSMGRSSVVRNRRRRGCRARAPARPLRPTIVRTLHTGSGRSRRVASARARQPRAGAGHRCARRRGMARAVRGNAGYRGDQHDHRRFRFDDAVLEACADAARARFTWVGEEFLLSKGRAMDRAAAVAAAADRGIMSVAIDRALAPASPSGRWRTRYATRTTGRRGSGRIRRGARHQRQAQAADRLANRTRLLREWRAHAPAHGVTPGRSAFSPAAMVAIRRPCAAAAARKVVPHPGDEGQCRSAAAGAYACTVSGRNPGYQDLRRRG